MFRWMILCSLFLTALACGGGGGGGSTATQNTTSFKVSSQDAATFAGVWYTSAFSIDSAQTMPQTVRELKYTFNTDGTWNALLAANYGSGVTVDTFNSENSASTATVLSFSYVIESANKVTLSETFSDSSGTHSASATLLKSGVDSTIAGTYDLDINSYRANGVNILTQGGYTANFFTITTNGEMTSTLVNSSFVQSTSVTNVVIRSGSVSNTYTIYLIDGAYQNCGVG
jgi:hypothetical protein